MQRKINQIRELVKKEIEQNKDLPNWFYDRHLLAVEKFSKFILKKYQKLIKK